MDNHVDTGNVYVLSNTSFLLINKNKNKKRREMRGKDRSSCWGTVFKKALDTELVAWHEEKWPCMTSKREGTSGMGAPSCRIVEYLGGGRGRVQRMPSHGALFSVIVSIFCAKKSCRAVLVAALKALRFSRVLFEMYLSFASWHSSVHQEFGLESIRGRLECLAQAASAS